MNTRTRNLLIALGLTAVLAVAVVVATQGGSDEDDTLPGSDAADLEALFEGIPQDGTLVGDPDADVTVVEFGDLQCPFCARFAAAVPELIEEHVRPGNVRLDFQPLDFIGPDSEPLARLVGAAALQDMAWPMAEVLYSRQGPENSGYATSDFLREAAEAVPGLDAEKAIEDMDSPEVDEILSQASALAEEVGVSGTPAFFVRTSDGGYEELELRSLDAPSFTEALERQRSG